MTITEQRAQNWRKIQKIVFNHLAKKNSNYLASMLLATLTKEEIDEIFDEINKQHEDEEN